MLSWQAMKVCAESKSMVWQAVHNLWASCDRADGDREDKYENFSAKSLIGDICCVYQVLEMDWRVGWSGEVEVDGDGSDEWGTS